MSIFQRLLNAIYPSAERRVLIVGMDASGKTTFLYQLMLGEVVKTIPTIGFNVENFSHFNPFSKKQTTYTFWDVGGCDKIRPLWRHYFQASSALLYFIDATRPDLKHELEWSLMLLTKEPVLFNVPIVLVVNKNDLPGAQTLSEISKMLDHLHYPNNQISTISCSILNHSDCMKVMDLLAKATANDIPTFNQQIVESSALEVWLDKNDIPDDEFIEQIEMYTLENWDHYTHLRLAWLNLTRYGRREGLKRIFALIENFILNSPRTNGKTFHETMTYFWCHMVHYAIESTKNPTGDFKGFLFTNPQLSDSGLFLTYYSKKLMLQTNETRTQVVLPDIKQLPSIISTKTQK
ncbi:hypothetical protein HK096_004210 [Nowakowskiella sp. JEL0078]|nr:hypothetical protein HK096_004210 [Nowakowskiella sp. JEL0078]